MFITSHISALRMRGSRTKDLELILGKLKCGVVLYHLEMLLFQGDVQGNDAIPVNLWLTEELGKTVQ